MEIKISTDAPFDMIAEELGAEWKRSEASKEAAVESKARCAMLMLRLREAAGSDNNKFSLALIDNDVTASKDERAAMLKFARLPERERNMIVSDMKRRSVASFLQENREGVFDLVEDPPSIQEQPESASPAEENEESTQRNASKTETGVKIDKRSSIYGRPRAEDLAGLLKMQKMGSALSRIHKNGWPLMLESFDMGLLSEKGVTIKKDTPARLLFNLPISEGMAATNYLAGFDLSTPKGCKRSEEELMPFLRKNREELKANPSSFWPLKVAEDTARRNAILKKENEATQARKMAEITARGEQEVVVAGVQIWPPQHDNIKTFSYEQLRLAWFIFIDAEGVAEANSYSKQGRKGRAMGHRHMANKIAMIGEMMSEEDRKHMDWVITAYHEITRAMESGADDNLQTKIPWTDIKPV